MNLDDLINDSEPEMESKGSGEDSNDTSLSGFCAAFNLESNARGEYLTKQMVKALGKEIGYTVMGKTKSSEWSEVLNTVIAQHSRNDDESRYLSFIFGRYHSNIVNERYGVNRDQDWCDAVHEFYTS